MEAVAKKALTSRKETLSWCYRPTLDCRQHMKVSGRASWLHMLSYYDLSILGTW